MRFTEWFKIVTWFAVLFRFWVRFRIVREPGWDDFFVILSAVRKSTDLDDEPFLTVLDVEHTGYRSSISV